MGLDLLRMCGIRAEDMTAIEMADAVAPVGQGADLHAKNSDGQTPNHEVCWYGHAEVVMALLEKGADVHVESVGNTPLYYACRFSHLNIAEMLPHDAPWGRSKSRVKRQTSGVVLARYV